MSSLNFQQLQTVSKTGKMVFSHRPPSSSDIQEYLFYSAWLPNTWKRGNSLPKASSACTPSTKPLGCVRFNGDCWVLHHVLVVKLCGKGNLVGYISGSKAQQVSTSILRTAVISKFEGILLYHLLMIVDGQWPTTFWDTIHSLQTATECRVPVSSFSLAWTMQRSFQLESEFKTIEAIIQNDLN